MTNGGKTVTLLSAEDVSPAVDAPVALAYSGGAPGVPGGIEANCTWQRQGAAPVSGPQLDVNVQVSNPHTNRDEARRHFDEMARGWHDAGVRTRRRRHVPAIPGRAQRARVLVGNRVVEIAIDTPADALAQAQQSEQTIARLVVGRL